MQREFNINKLLSTYKTKYKAMGKSNKKINKKSTITNDIEDIEDIGKNKQYEKKEKTKRLLTKKTLDIGTFFTNLRCQGYKKLKLNWKLILPLSLLIPTLTLTTIFGVNSTKAYKISVDNNFVCVAKTVDQAQNILNDIKNQFSVKYETEIIIPNDISYENFFFAGKKINSEEEIKYHLEECISLIAECFEISVDGKSIGFLKDKFSAEEVLNKIKAPYIKEDDDINAFSFLENVNIIEREIPVEQLQSVEEVLNYISTPNEQKKTYTVKNGDTISEIAEEFGIKVKDIQKANPDIKIDKIAIGQELNLTVPRYIINIVKKDYKSYEENIPFEKKYEDNSEMYRGQTKVKIEGVEGKKLVKAEVVSINGIAETTNIIGEEIIESPKDAIILMGTKERPRTLAYGEFIMPSRGSISSRFGQRWSSQHTGVDIAVPRGTPNKAADGGVVTFAGWSGGYGKLVIVDHENGFTTYYAHNDTITVKKGQRVARGDTVGTAGTTGNATGPHLHFEVRKNGVPVDPLKYLK